MSRRSEAIYAAELSDDQRLLEAMRAKAPRAQALREEVASLLDLLPIGAHPVLDMLLIELGMLADSGLEVRPDSEDDVRELVKEVRGER